MVHLSEAGPRSELPIRRLASPGARDAIAIGALALALRVFWVLVYGRTTPAGNDTLFYQVASASLSHGDGFRALQGDVTAHWPPGFPFLVSLGYRVFGVHPHLGLWINVVLSTATAILLYLVARRMLGRPAALVAGTAFALLPGSVLFTGLFLSETTFIFMLVGFLALAVFLPDRRWTPVVLGVAVGLAALTKGEGLLLLVIPIAMWSGLHARGEVVRRSAVLVAVAALTIVPWTIRNVVVMDSFIPVSTNASTTLWSGHNPKANGGPVYAPPELLDRIPKTLPPKQAEVEEAGLLRREAVDWAVHNPHKELGLIPRKLVALNSGTSGAIDTWFNAGRERQLPTSSRILYGILSDAAGFFLLFVTLAALLLLGARRLWHVHPGMRGVLAYLGACLVLYGFVYYGQYRYRVPMEPLMLLVAAPLVAAVWARRDILRRGIAGDG